MAGGDGFAETPQVQVFRQNADSVTGTAVKLRVREFDPRQLAPQSDQTNAVSGDAFGHGFALK